MRYFILLSIFFLLSCEPKTKSETANDTTIQLDSTTQEAEAYEEPNSSELTTKLPYEGQLFQMDSINVVFVFPDSTEIANMKKEYGDDFYVIADDAGFYFSEAVDFLENRNVKYETTKLRYIETSKYKLTGEKTIIDTDTIDSKWVLIMNDGYDAPIISNFIDIQTDFQELDE